MKKYIVPISIGIFMLGMLIIQIEFWMVLRLHAQNLKVWDAQVEMNESLIESCNSPI